MFFFVFIALFVPSINAYSSGAPCGQIDQMTPGHGPAQNSQAPYWIQLGATCYTPGVPVSVTLQGQQSLKGFVLQARGVCPGNQNSRAGAFPETSDYKHQCENDGSSITHRSGSPKSAIITNWAPPADSFGSVQFIATVVRDYSTFWVQQVKSTDLKPCSDLNVSCVKESENKPEVSQQNDCSFLNNKHPGGDSQCEGWIRHIPNSCAQTRSYVNVNCQKSCCQAFK